MWIHYYEEICALSEDGLYFCFTRLHPGIRQDKLSDPQHQYAFIGHIDDPTQKHQDILDLVSVRLPVNEAKARAQAQIAQSQLDYARQQKYTTWQQYYLESHANFLYEAAQWRKPSRRLPIVAWSTPTRHLLTYVGEWGVYDSLDGSYSCIRLLDPQQRQVLLDESPQRPRQLLPRGDRDRRVRGETQRGKPAESIGTPIAIKPDASSALCCTHDGLIRAVKLQPGLPQLFAPLSIGRSYQEAFWCNNSWVIPHYGYHNEESVLYVIDEQSGETAAQFRFPNHINTISAALTQPRVLIADGQGFCTVLDLVDGSQRAYKPNWGMANPYLLEVCMSADGAFFASWHRDQKQLILTEIATGRSAVVCQLAEHSTVIKEDDHRFIDKVLTPGFAWSGDTLLTLSQGTVTAYRLPAIYAQLTWFESAAESWQRTFGWHIEATLPIDTILQQPELASIAPVIEQLWSSAPTFTTERIDTQSLPVGSTRFGGNPDLAAPTLWPRWNHYPMIFLLQLNLAEIAQLFPDSPLPKRGLLSFFAGVNDDLYGPSAPIVPEEFGMVKVLYQDNLDNLQPVAYPGPTEPLLRYQLPTCRLLFTGSGLRLPALDATPIARQQWQAIEREHYSRLLQQVNPPKPEYPPHQLLGYTDPVQHNQMELEAALAMHGFNFTTFTRMSEEQQAMFQQQATEWRLLLQLPSDPKAELDWGNGVTSYWFIRLADLQVGNFDRIWMGVQ